MPLYEFVCNQCAHPFEELVRGADSVGELACPKCGSAQIKKKLSSFASKVAGGSSFSLGSGASAACTPGGT